MTSPDDATRNFWASLREFNKEHPYVPDTPRKKHQHGGMDTAKLWSTCEPCARKRIKRMAEKPSITHEGRNGRRLAEKYGVEYTPFESRSEISRKMFGRHEQERREKER